MSGAEIRAALGVARITWRTETDLQAGISQVLTAAGSVHQREVSLTAEDRIDFLAGNVGIEVKVKGSLSSVARQLQRYAHSDQVGELILVTTRPQHTDMPSEIAGVFVSVLLMHGGAW